MTQHLVLLGDEIHIDIHVAYGRLSRVGGDCAAVGGAVVQHGWGNGAAVGGAMVLQGVGRWCRMGVGRWCSREQGYEATGGGAMV